MAVYSGDKGENGYCFSCEKSTADPYLNSDKEEFKEIKKPEEASIDINNIRLKKIEPLKSRGISKEACLKYGVRCDVKDSLDQFHYYPHTSKGETVSYMSREVSSKSFKSIGSNKNLEFFGQSLAGTGGRMVIVTEGQADCLAAFDMLAKCSKKYRVVSIVNGASSAVKCFKDNYDWISSFENIFLAFDSDEPGQKAAKAVSELFEPEKVKLINMGSYKDPNDMLIADKHQEFLRAIFDSKGLRETGIVSVQDIYDKTLEDPVVGLSFPWKSLTDATYGYRRGELYGLGGPSGSGKSFAFKTMIRHTAFVHKLRVGIIFLEEPTSKTLKTIVGIEDGKHYHVPRSETNDWDKEDLKRGLESLKDKLFLFDHFGQKDWESIKTTIRYMVNALGIKDIYLDHLTALVAQASSEYTEMNKIMEELASLTEELDCTIFFISHLRKASGTASHEEGARVTADQFKGSGSIVFWSHFLFGIERNQQSEDREERDITTFRVLKDRNTGNSTGLTFRLKYIRETGQWAEINEEEFDDETF